MRLCQRVGGNELLPIEFAAAELQAHPLRHIRWLPAGVVSRAAAGRPRRCRNVETALDAHLAGLPDDEQLAYAASAGRTLYTFNVSDFMTLHSAFMAEGRAHAGIIFGQQQHYGVGEQMRRLRRLIALRSIEAMRNNFEFLRNWG